MTDTGQHRAIDAADGAEIAIRREGAVATISFDRPLRRNSMDAGFVEGCATALRTLAADGTTRAVVMHARNIGFCAGSDLKFIAPLEPDAICRFEAECAALGRQIAHAPFPVIAAVEAFAIGGGMTLATCCDLVVTGRSAKWALPEVPIGWLTPWGIWSLETRVGPHRARTLCYCLETLTGEDAVRLGLADVLCDDGAALQTAMERADRLARLPAGTVARTKAFFAREILARAEAGDARSNRAFARDLDGDAARATLRSFRGEHA